MPQKGLVKILIKTDRKNQDFIIR